MIVVVRKSSPDRVFADMTEGQYSEFGHLYPAADYDVWRTEELAFAPGPLPVVFEVVDREAVE